jgi:DNA-directed RNA polymerase specialized sigma24 family protein
MKRMRLALRDGADALSHLPTEQRVTLELAYRFQYSREDIARVLNCSVEAVMTQMSEATRALRMFGTDGVEHHVPD